MPWLKAFHIVFMVSWFAGLLYLPRLFVYHAMTDDEPGRERFCLMEGKLLRIMAIGAVGTVAFGLALLHPIWPAVGGQLWLQLKLLAVAGLVAYHLVCVKMARDFRRRRSTRSHVFYRVFNEIPAILLIGIAILVFVRPL